MDDEIPVTDSMRRAVRREECTQHGHTYDVIIEMLHEDPTALICTCCGKSWLVSPRDHA